MRKQRTHLAAIKISWCAAAKMQLFDRASAVEQLRLHRDFLIKVPQVAIYSFRVACNDLVARAVVAKRLAKRNVYVKG